MFFINFIFFQYYFCVFKSKGDNSKNFAIAIASTFESVFFLFVIEQVLSLALKGQEDVLENYFVWQPLIAIGLIIAVCLINMLLIFDEKRIQKIWDRYGIHNNIMMHILTTFVQIALLWTIH